MTEFDPIVLALPVVAHNQNSEVASIGSTDDQPARPLVVFVKAAR